MGMGAWCGGPDMVRGLKWGVRYGRPWNGGGGGGRLIWYCACNGGPGVVRNVPNPAPTNKIFPQFTQVTWASARRLIAHLIAYITSINAMGECCYGFDLSMLMLILQHSVWSWSLWCFYMLFNCYFKECFNAKGRTKNRDIDFLRLFSLGFQRSFKTEVLCCTQSIMW